MHMFMLQCQTQKKLNRNATAFLPKRKQNTTENNNFIDDVKEYSYVKRKVLNELSNKFQVITKDTKHNNASKIKTKQQPQKRKNKMKQNTNDDIAQKQDHTDFRAISATIEHQDTAKQNNYKDSNNRYAILSNQDEDDIETIYDDFDEHDTFTDESEEHDKDNQCPNDINNDIALSKSEEIQTKNLKITSHPLVNNFPSVNIDPQNTDKPKDIEIGNAEEKDLTKPCKENKDKSHNNSEKTEIINKNLPSHNTEITVETNQNLHDQNWTKVTKKNIHQSPKSKNSKIKMKPTTSENRNEFFAYRNQLLNNVCEPLIEEMQYALSQAKRIRSKKAEEVIQDLQLSWNQARNKLKAVPNIKSLKIIDYDIEQLYNKSFATHEFTSLLDENSNFYVTPTTNDYQHDIVHIESSKSDDTNINPEQETVETVSDKDESIVFSNTKLSYTSNKTKTNRTEVEQEKSTRRTYVERIPDENITSYCDRLYKEVVSPVYHHVVKVAHNYCKSLNEKDQRTDSVMINFRTIVKEMRNHESQMKKVKTFKSAKNIASETVRLYHTFIDHPEHKIFFDNDSFRKFNIPHNLIPDPHADPPAIESIPENSSSHYS